MPQRIENAAMSMALDAVDLAREATEAEVEHYHANGWVKMEGLISPALAARMLRIARVEIMDKAVDGVKSHVRREWSDVYNLGRDDGVEPFATLVRSRHLGRNAQRFMRRDVPVAVHADMMAVKMPMGDGLPNRTGAHQDWPNFPLDRTGLLTFWIALEDMTPDQGTMHFYSGSHTAGPLGRRNTAEDERGILDHYPYIETLYPKSPPISLKAGDCTVHNSLVIHAAASNTTDRPRWSYLISCFPGDACWTGAPHHIFNAEAGLTPGRPVSSPKFPVIAEGKVG